MEWLKNNLPIISIYLITLGIIHLNAFYSYFGINITSYLDLAEIIQLQFDYFATLIGIVIVSNITTALLNNIRNEDKEADDDVYTELIRPNKIQRRESYKRAMKEVRIRTKLSLFSICIIVMCVFFYQLFTMHLIYYTAIELAFIIFIIYFILITPESLLKLLKGSNINRKTANKRTRTIVLITISFIMTFEYARSDAFVLDVKRSSNEVSIALEKENINTNDSVIFLGKTKNYIFLYNRFTGQSNVYPFGSVKTIKYLPGKKHKSVPQSYKAETLYKALHL